MHHEMKLAFLVDQTRPAEFADQNARSVGIGVEFSSSDSVVEFSSAFSSSKGLNPGWCARPASILRRTILVTQSDVADLTVVGLAI